jgi:hypothetical protein
MKPKSEQDLARTRIFLILNSNKKLKRGHNQIFIGLSSCNNVSVSQHKLKERIYGAPPKRLGRDFRGLARPLN